jgi:hypothetical protein
MRERLRSAFGNLGYFIIWLVLAALAGLTGFQLYATLIAVSIAVIENPSLRPIGWSMDTTYGLSRVFWVVIGILWLGWVMYTEGHLREGKNRQILIKRSLGLLLVLGGIYALSYLLLLLLA